MCNEVQNVGAIDFAFRGSKMKVACAFDKPIGESNCVGCGQCAAVCPTAAIVIKDDAHKLWNELNDPDTLAIAQVAPAVRVAVAKEFGYKGENVMGKITAALRRIGFDLVFDTSTAADLTVMEESNEFIERLEKGGPFPMFTSCCPAWIKYAENEYPDYLPNISSCRSPMQMFASVIAEQYKDCGKRLLSAAVMPCTAKKMEAARDEFKDENGKMNRSLEDIKGDMLIVSNITLSADMKHGRRPDFSRSASPSEALRLYNYFVEQVKNQPIGKVCTGEFGAHMHVSVENDGPVNIIIDTERIGK